MEAPQSSRTRRVLLEQGATAVAERWASTWREDLRKQGRPASGGWPGTVPEARARVTAYLGAELARRRMRTLSSDEAGWATQATYASAKRDWLARVDRDDPDPI